MKATGEANMQLVDDGTLDTVIRCADCGEEYRYNDLDPDLDGVVEDFTDWCLNDAAEGHVCGPATSVPLRCIIGRDEDGQRGVIAVEVVKEAVKDTCEACLSPTNCYCKCDTCEAVRAVRFPGGVVGGVPKFNAANRAFVEKSNDHQRDDLRGEHPISADPDEWDSFIR